MAKQKNLTLDALLFVDTNIILDFYRIRKVDVSMDYLGKLESHKNIIITSSQVEMEYKKNRQSAVMESIAELKKMANINLGTPAIVSNVKALEMMKRHKSDINKQQKRIQEKIKKILKNPSGNDQVYKTFQRIFKYKSDLNLNRTNDKRHEIRELAKKRFYLGYPPRKKSDVTYGDSINWEWIIECASEKQKNVIIVTRDSDFGTITSEGSYVNDWLKQEFKERVGKNLDVVLTDKLSYAFKLVKIPVTRDMVKEEKRIIRRNDIIGNLKLSSNAVDAMINAKKIVEVTKQNRLFFERMKDYFGDMDSEVDQPEE